MIARNRTIFYVNGVPIVVHYKTGGELPLNAKAGDGAFGQVFIVDEFTPNETTGTLVLSHDPANRETDLNNYRDIYRESLNGKRYVCDHYITVNYANGVREEKVFHSQYGSIKELTPTGDSGTEKEWNIVVGFGTIEFDKIS